ncbi:hypothetical protein L195_g009710 [Trifolium pratense]|uniref:Uncharacterized protein n=1 Tax=Trifolium pratense TaxID=57577 RepID=A0A2K3PCQ2_TRIPR|nr:hypothetical protein L195_g009710 [Trifolium pratense]
MSKFPGSLGGEINKIVLQMQARELGLIRPQQEELGTDLAALRFQSHHAEEPRVEVLGVDLTRSTLQPDIELIDGEARSSEYFTEPHGGRQCSRTQVGHSLDAAT